MESRDFEKIITASGSFLGSVEDHAKILAKLKGRERVMLFARSFNPSTSDRFYFNICYTDSAGNIDNDGKLNSVRAWIDRKNPNIICVDTDEIDESGNPITNNFSGIEHLKKAFSRNQDATIPNQTPFHLINIAQEDNERGLLASKEVEIEKQAAKAAELAEAHRLEIKAQQAVSAQVRLLQGERAKMMQSHVSGLTLNQDGTIGSLIINKTTGDIAMINLAGEIQKNTHNQLKKLIIKYPTSIKAPIFSAGISALAQALKGKNIVALEFESLSKETFDSFYFQKLGGYKQLQSVLEENRNTQRQTLPPNVQTMSAAGDALSDQATAGPPLKGYDPGIKFFSSREITPLTSHGTPSTKASENPTLSQSDIDRVSRVLSDILNKKTFSEAYQAKRNSSFFKRFFDFSGGRSSRKDQEEKLGQVTRMQNAINAFQKNPNLDNLKQLDKVSATILQEIVKEEKEKAYVFQSSLKELVGKLGEVTTQVIVDNNTRHAHPPKPAGPKE